MSSTSLTISQIARATAALRQVQDTISKQSKKLVKIPQLKMSIKILEDNMAFYEANEQSLKSEHAAAKTESTWLGQSFDGVRAEVAYSQKRSGARDAVTRCIAEDSCAMLGPSIKSLVDDFCADLNKLVSETLRATSIGSHFHADAGVDGIALCVLEGAASDNGDGFTKGEDVFYPPADRNVIAM